MEITILGTGNVASQLAPALEEAGHNIVGIYGRNKKKAATLASFLYESKATDSLNFLDQNPGIFILAVADQAIGEIVSHAHFPAGSIVVHTAGAVSLDILEAASTLTGVFYPLMTIHANKPTNWKNTPICIESNSKTALDILKKLGKSISLKVHVLSSEQREWLHLAAVFSCNFTNHLLAISHALLESEELPLEIVQPLVEATLKNAFSSKNPATTQTGPAVRKDLQTLQKHLQLLEEDVEIQKLYKTLTESILDWHKEE